MPGHDRIFPGPVKFSIYWLLCHRYYRVLKHRQRCKVNQIVSHSLGFLQEFMNFPLAVAAVVTLNVFFLIFYQSYLLSTSSQIVVIL